MGDSTSDDVSTDRIPDTATEPAAAANRSAADGISATYLVWAEVAGTGYRLAGLTTTGNTATKWLSSTATDKLPGTTTKWLSSTATNKLPGTATDAVQAAHGSANGCVHSFS